MGEVLEMRTSFSRLAALMLALGMTVSACGNDKDANAGARIIKDVGTLLVARTKGGGAPAAAPAITRAQLAAFNSPMIMAKLPATGITSFFVPYGRNGDVETWASPEGQTLSFRQGILIATRGFGPDLMQSAGPTIGQIASGSGSYSRIYEYLDGADQNLRRKFDCSLSGHGSATITVVERQHTTRLVRETCVGNGADFTNEYWFEGGNFLRKSNQLLVPEWGVLEIQRVVDKG
jgi:hypothetical protein